MIATFALDGPEMCAGLPVVRYDADSLAEEFSGLLECLGCRSHTGSEIGADARQYVICNFRKLTVPESKIRQES